MTHDPLDDIEFDELLTLAIARSASAGVTPRPDVKQRLLARIAESHTPPSPGFSFRVADERDWLPHQAKGIRMKLLAINRERGYAVVLLDCAPGARLPAHRHRGAEECYVISGSLTACGRRIGPGDFHHADADSSHDELWTDEGCRVLLVVDPADYFPPASA